MAKKRSDQPSGLMSLIVEAIAPALIIGMICCLVFFLIVAFYRGEFDLRLMYILGLFTLGVVLIARIAIESGRGYANGFAIPLAIVTVLAMMRFVTVQGELAPLSWLFNIGLLGLVWYLADRITYDCTLDDRKRKVRQEGLLQTLGLVTRPVQTAQPDDPISKQMVVKTPPLTDSKARHNPGVWVLRFALLALPLFGFGQLVISDPAARNHSFWFLFGYLACALGLLVCTSLLSVRRYLHDRGATMPAEVVSIWLCSGAIGVFLILALCILLPLPGRSLGLIELPFEIGSPKGLLSSRFGWGSEGSTDDQNAEAAKSESDQGEPSGAPEPDGKGPPQPADNAPKNAPQKNSDSGEQGETSKSNDSSSGEPAAGKSAKDSPQPKQSSQKQPSESNKKSGKKSQGDAADDQKAEARDAEQKGDAGEQEPRNSGQERGSDRKIERQENESQRKKSSSQKSSSQKSSSQRSSGGQQSTSFNNLLNSFNADFATLFKWLTIVILVLFVVIYAITHPREVAKLLRDIADFFAALFGRKPAISKQTQTGVQRTDLELKRALAPFGSYTNPFQSGEQLSGVIVVERTFAALESWAAEAGVTRSQDETSREFVGRLVTAVPKLGKTPILAASMLDQVMFAAWKPTANDLQPLEQLWRTLSKSS